MKVIVSLTVDLDDALRFLPKTHWTRQPPEAVLKSVMCDAFAEFRAHRNPPGEYVGKRYPEGPPIIERRREGESDEGRRERAVRRKVDEVRTRVAVSEALKQSVFTSTMTEVPDDC